jgi:hypothetical protein
MNSFTKFEEEKQCDEERSLVASLKAFKTIQYIFEVDGQQMINSDDSLGNSSVQLQKKYQEINEMNIQENVVRMMMPLTNTLNAPTMLTEARLLDLPQMKSRSLERDGSMQSYSTCMGSDQDSMSSGRSFSSDHPGDHHEEVHSAPVMP